MHSSMGVIFMGAGIAKIHEQPIPEQLGDMSIVALDNVGTHPLIGTHHVTPVFRVELSRQGGGFHEVTKYHGQLSTFSFGSMRGHDRRCGCDRWGGVGQSRWDRLARRSRDREGCCDSAGLYQNTVFL